MILVIDNYDSFTWNLVHYLMELGAEVEVVRNDALSAGQAISSGAKGFLISPGPCTPNEAGISLDLVGACADAKLPAARRVPGPPVDRPVFRRQGGARRADARQDLAVTHDGTGLFTGLPSPFIATRYHSLIVTDIPDCLVVNCHLRRRPRDGLPPQPAADPRRAVPSRKHRHRTRPCDARQLPADLRDRGPAAIA
jgi:anthranilate synthase component 2